jgi:hypothetical protein
VMGAFAVGLRPILARADVEAFRQYLSRWDEVLGDTSALTMQSDGEVRRTMLDMLRRPKQFGLPTWAEAPIEGQVPNLVEMAPPASASHVGRSDLRETVLDETSVGSPTTDDGPLPSVDDVTSMWLQIDFVAGTLVEADGQVTRAVPVRRAEAPPRSGPRVPRGFRQLVLPLGQSD